MIGDNIDCLQLLKDELAFQIGKEDGALLGGVCFTALTAKGASGGWLRRTGDETNLLSGFSVPKFAEWEYIYIFFCILR